MPKHAAPLRPVGIRQADEGHAVRVCGDETPDRRGGGQRLQCQQGDAHERFSLWPASRGTVSLVIWEGLPPDWFLGWVRGGGLVDGAGTHHGVRGKSLTRSADALRPLPEGEVKGMTAIDGKDADDATYVRVDWNGREMMAADELRVGTEKSGAARRALRHATCGPPICVVITGASSGLGAGLGAILCRTGAGSRAGRAQCRAAGGDRRNLPRCWRNGAPGGARRRRSGCLGGVAERA